MLNQEAFKRQSQVLNSLRIPATIMVILSHCVITTKQKLVSFDLTVSNIFLFIESLFLSFGPIAVSAFAVISGYYFFYKYQSFTPKDYGIELKKRAISLYLPFVLWNLITWGLLYAKNEIALRIGFAPGFNQLEYYNATHIKLWHCLYSPVDYPLWYIKSIIVLCLCTPLIYLVIRYTKYISLLLVALFAMDLLGIDAQLHENTITYFCIGSFLGYYKQDIIALARRVRWASYATGWLYCYGRTFGAGYEWVKVLLPFFLFCSIVAIINLATDIYEARPSISAWFSSFNAAAFFMYAAHTIIFINIIRGTLYSIIPWDNDWERLLALFVTSITVPVCTYYSYRLLSAISPRLSQILSGGRG